MVSPSLKDGTSSELLPGTQQGKRSSLLLLFLDVANVKGEGEREREREEERS
jgi:hypothetical protein